MSDKLKIKIDKRSRGLFTGSFTVHAVVFPMMGDIADEEGIQSISKERVAENLQQIFRAENIELVFEEEKSGISEYALDYLKSPKSEKGSRT